MPSEELYRGDWFARGWALKTLRVVPWAVSESGLKLRPKAMVCYMLESIFRGKRKNCPLTSLYFQKVVFLTHFTTARETAVCTTVSPAAHQYMMNTRMGLLAILRRQQQEPWDFPGQSGASLLKHQCRERTALRYHTSVIMYGSVSVCQLHR